MATAPGKIAFVSNSVLPWGGSEELWSRTALALLSKGYQVSASVRGQVEPSPHTLNLQSKGVDVWSRPWWPSWRRDLWQQMVLGYRDRVAFEVARLIRARRPALVVISECDHTPRIELLEMCIAEGVPFATIHQCNNTLFWLTDELAPRYRAVLARALRCFFVCDANRRLLEKQIGGRIPNAEVVWNPVNLPPDISPPAWPSLETEDGVRFACVGRLHPVHKGQDALFEALAGPVWKDRRWRLYLYGEGPMREGFKWLCHELGLADRVVFAGFVPPEEIWASNHVLVMPSRFEGLPLAIVEAMLCARPVIATDVGGNCEVVEDGVTGFIAEAPTPRSLGKAMERFWARRHEAEQIGRAGAQRIHDLLPPDPIQLLADKIAALADAAIAIGRR